MSATATSPFWIIGCGAMGGAMLSRWLATGLDPARVTVIRPSGAPVAPGVRVLTEVPNEPAPALLMLAIKPHQIKDIARTLQSAAGTATCVISILAGTRLETLRVHFPLARAVVRAMPNLPVALGNGVVALAGDVIPAIDALMAPLGLVERIDDEGLFDLVTALAGSGPAFAYRFIDALAGAGAALGLPGEQAARLALATVAGAAALASASDLSPAALADQVASKGGSTRKGLDILDDGGALVALLKATLAAAEARNREMAQAKD